MHRSLKTLCRSMVSYAFSISIFTAYLTLVLFLHVSLDKLSGRSLTGLRVGNLGLYMEYHSKHVCIFTWVLGYYFCPVNKASLHSLLMKIKAARNITRSFPLLSTLYVLCRLKQREWELSKSVVTAVFATASGAFVFLPLSSQYGIAWMYLISSHCPASRQRRRVWSPEDLQAFQLYWTGKEGCHCLQKVVKVYSEASKKYWIVNLCTFNKTYWKPRTKPRNILPLCGVIVCFPALLLICTSQIPKVSSTVFPPFFFFQV